MQRREGTLWLSPTDLSAHLGCAHLTTLALEVADGLRVKPSTDQRLHEDDLREGQSSTSATIASSSVAEGATVVEVKLDRADWAAGAARTEELMRARRRRHLPGAVRVRRLARRRRLPRAHRHAVGARRLLLRGRRHQARAHRDACRTTRCSSCFYAAGIAARAGRLARRTCTSSSARAERESIRLREIGSYARHAKNGHGDARRAREPRPSRSPARTVEFCALPADLRGRSGRTSTI